MISHTLFSLYAMLRKGSDFYDHFLRILRIEILLLAYFQRWWRGEVNLWKNMKQRRSIFLLFCQLYIVYISICCIVVLSNERFYIFSNSEKSWRNIEICIQNIQLLENYGNYSNYLKRREKLISFFLQTCKNYLYLTVSLLFNRVHAFLPSLDIFIKLRVIFTDRSRRIKFSKRLASHIISGIQAH